MQRNIDVDYIGLALRGSADLPATPAQNAVLLLHGFTGSRIEFSYLYVHLARLLNAQGIAVFRFDFAGCGESEGDFADLSIHDQAAQTDVLLDQLATAYPGLRWHLLGFSMGALAASISAARRTDLASLLLVAPASNLHSNVLKTAKQAATPLDNGGYDFIGLEISAAFLEEVAAFDLAAVLPKLKLPTLVLHGENDGVVPAQLGRAAAAQIAGGHYQEITGADHVFAQMPHRRALADAIAAWIRG